MSYRFAVSIPAPGLVEIAQKAEEVGLTVSITSPDHDDVNGVILTVEYDSDYRDEAQELEDLALGAWDEFED
jgi:hypothetical protein